MNINDMITMWQLKGVRINTNTLYSVDCHNGEKKNTKAYIVKQLDIKSKNSFWDNKRATCIVRFEDEIPKKLINADVFHVDGSAFIKDISLNQLDYWVNN